MTHGVIAGATIGGGQLSTAEQQNVAAIEAGAAQLRSRLVAEGLPASSFWAWWAPRNPWHWSDFTICVAADPEHAEAERAAALIEQLPDEFDGFEVFACPFPHQPVIEG